MPAIYSKEALERRRAEALRRSEQLRLEGEEARREAIEEMRKMIEKPGYLDAQMDAARWLGVADTPAPVRAEPDVMVQTEPLVNRLRALPSAPAAGAMPPSVSRSEPRVESRGWIRGATRPEPQLEPPGPDTPPFDWPVLGARPAQIHWPATPGPRGIHRLPAQPAPAPEREEPRHGRFGPGWVRPPAVAPAPEREEPRHGRFGPGWVPPPVVTPAPPAPPPAPAPDLPEFRRVKTVPVAPSDRPQGSIGRNAQPSSVPGALDLPGIDNPEAEIPFVPSPQDVPLEGHDFGYWNAVVWGLASDVEEMRRDLAKEIFPDKPFKEALSRIEYRDDTFVYRTDNGDLYYALPRGSISKALTWSGQILPLAGGGIGTAVALRNPKAAYVTVPTGLAIGEIIRQGIGDRMLGGAATPGINWDTVILKAGGGVVGRRAAVAARSILDSIGWDLPEIPTAAPYR